MRINHRPAKYYFRMTNSMQNTYKIVFIVKKITSSLYLAFWLPPHLTFIIPMGTPDIYRIGNSVTWDRITQLIFSFGEVKDLIFYLLHCDLFKPSSAPYALMNDTFMI